VKVYEYIIRLKDQATDKVGRFVNSVTRGRDRMNRFNDSIDQGTKSGNAFGGVLNTLTRYLGTAALAAALTTAGLKASALARDFEQTTISFEVMIGNAKQGRALLSEIETMAVKTPFKSSDLQSSGKLLLGYGVNAAKIMPTLKMLGDIAGGNAEKLHLLSLAFAQSQAAGRLMGQDLLQMVNAGFNPLQTISEKTGISIGVLKKQMEEGAISARMVEAAFRAATQEGGRFYNMMDRQSSTFEGRLNALSEKWDIWLRTIGSRINERLAPYIEKLVVLMDKLIDPKGVVARSADQQADSFHKLYTQTKPLIDQYEKLVGLQKEGKLTTEQQSELLKVSNKLLTQVPTAETGAKGPIPGVDIKAAKSYLQDQEDAWKGMSEASKLDAERQLEVLSRLRAELNADKKLILDDKGVAGIGVGALQKKYLYGNENFKLAWEDYAEMAGLKEGNTPGDKISEKLKQALQTGDHTKILQAYNEEFGKLSEKAEELTKRLAKLRTDKTGVYLADDSGPKDDWKKMGDDIMGGKSKDGTDKITGGGKQAINVTINVNKLNGIETVEQVNGQMEIKDLMKLIERVASETVIEVMNSGNYATQQK
jgi:tape measure domain-containing protein